ncbi:DUF6262 family protein [Rhodococcus sp. FXJ9.536]|uniref:DUF6262 family protein n=1 Tax=Rhodococcus tibetensis TaxID=2965064 RepID=A0ABT1QBK0_9NOCA|nr:DUF6262 family protein [Rhodococcus sp. FXJ9.536]
MNKRGEPVNFRRVARKGQVSLDFLYRNTELRETITRLRSRHQSASAVPVEPDPQSTIVRTLTRQLRDAKAEITRLQAALAAAHGENLALRRTQNHPDTNPHNSHHAHDLKLVDRPIGTPFSDRHPVLH